MRYKYMAVFFLPVLISLTSCSSRSSELADDLYHCTQPVLEFEQNYKGPTTDIKQFHQPLQAMYREVDSCMAPLRAKYAGEKGDTAFYSAVARKFNDKYPEMVNKVQIRDFITMLFRDSPAESGDQ